MDERIKKTMFCCRNECPIAADHALALVAIPFIATKYDVLQMDNKLLQQGTIDMLSGISSNFSFGLDALKKLSGDNLGLENVWRCPEYDFKSQKKPSTLQNARGIWLIEELYTEAENTFLDVSV